jgi:hypothetical protein
LLAHDPKNIFVAFDYTCFAHYDLCNPVVRPSMLAPLLARHGKYQKDSIITASILDKTKAHLINCSTPSGLGIFSQVRSRALPWARG